MRLNYPWYGTTRNLHLFEFQDFSIKEIPGHTFCNLVNVKCSCCCCYYCYYYYYSTTITAAATAAVVFAAVLYIQTDV